MGESGFRRTCSLEPSFDPDINMPTKKHQPRRLVFFFAQNESVELLTLVT